MDFILSFLTCVFIGMLLGAGLDGILPAKKALALGIAAFLFSSLISVTLCRIEEAIKKR